MVISINLHFSELKCDKHQCSVALYFDGVNTCLFLDDLGMSSCRQKLAKHYSSVFKDILLYTYDKEPTNKALHEMYVPMLWKQVMDPDTVHKDVEINSPLDLFEKVIIVFTFKNDWKSFHSVKMWNIDHIVRFTFRLTKNV